MVSAFELSAAWAAFTFAVKCKAMTEAKLSVKNQIVIPSEARRALGVKPGDKLLVVVQRDRVIILQKPKSHYGALRGLAARSHPKDYLERERRSWR